MPFQRSATASTGSAGFAAAVSAVRFGSATTFSGRRPHRLARGIGIVRRPFPAGALAEHAAQPQENEHCERQENDGVNVEHVSHAFGYRGGTSAGFKRLQPVRSAGRRRGRPHLCQQMARTDP